MEELLLLSIRNILLPYPVVAIATLEKSGLLAYHVAENPIRSHVNLQAMLPFWWHREGLESQSPIVFCFLLFLFFVFFLIFLLPIVGQ